MFGNGMPFLNHEMRSVEAATAPIEIIYTAVCIISYIMRMCEYVW